MSADECRAIKMALMNRSDLRHRVARQAPVHAMGRQNRKAIHISRCRSRLGRRLVASSKSIQARSARCQKFQTFKIVVCRRFRGGGLAIMVNGVQVRAGPCQHLEAIEMPRPRRLKGGGLHVQFFFVEPHALSNEKIVAFGEAIRHCNHAGRVPRFCAALQIRPAPQAYCYFRQPRVDPAGQGLYIFPFDCHDNH